jgi:branched-chain amino acid aminotransferase
VIKIKDKENHIEKNRHFDSNSITYIKSDLYPDGQFLRTKDARLSIWDLGFRHGAATYDTFRTLGGNPWQLKEHLKRFIRSCKACFIEIGLDRNELEQICRETVKKNQHLVVKEKGEDCSFWIEATPGEYGSYGRKTPSPKGKGKPTLIVSPRLINIKQLAKDYTEGIRLVTPSTRNPPPMVMDPKIKTHSRHFHALALHETHLMDPHAYPLLLDIYGNLSETHGNNIFLVYDGVLMTPTTRNILEGVNRTTVIKTANQLNIDIVERDLQPFHLYNADEAFISSTSRFVSPVSHYNNVAIPSTIPGPITKRLMESFKKMINFDITGVSFIKTSKY